jgi:hypothetical protein
MRKAKEGDMIKFCTVKLPFSLKFPPTTAHFYIFVPPFTSEIETIFFRVCLFHTISISREVKQKNLLIKYLNTFLFREFCVSGTYT